MSDNTPVPAVMDEEQTLAYTQNLRVKIINKITQNGVNVLPGDRAEQGMLSAQLDALERVALTNKRIKSDEQSAEGNNAVASALIAKLLTQAGTRKDTLPFVEEREIPSLGLDIPNPSLVPGETETSPRQLDYDSFMSGQPPREDQSSSNSSED